MVRAACCDKVGMKKGPWSPQEDEILMSYIRTRGHTNWRALPKAAGLLRCGKSCRLRWTNYLRPDIKRGNFTLEEEDAIINLHRMLGNRWSAIAAQLPGRTDNEIKNVWNTHLKKRQLINPAPGQHPNRKTRIGVKAIQAAASKSKTRRNKTAIIKPSTDSVSAATPSESYSCTDIVSCSAAVHESSNSISSGDGDEESMQWDHGPAVVVEEMIEESFWTQTLFMNSSDAPSMNSSSECLPSFPPDSHASIEDGMSFWYSVLMQAGDLPAI